MRPPQFPQLGRTQAVPRAEDEAREPSMPPLLLLSLGANVMLLLLLLLVMYNMCRRSPLQGQATTTAEAAKLEAALATAKQKRPSEQAIGRRSSH